MSRDQMPSDAPQRHRRWPATPLAVLSPGQLGALACLLEVSAPKPGNVHRGCDFENLTLVDFLASSVAIVPALERAATAGVGPTVLAAIEATRNLVGTNTNLGTLLLLAPLAAVRRPTPLRDGLPAVLAGLTSADSRDVYAAIRLAQAGGLGTVDAMDVAGPAPDDLRSAMAAAAERDLVARQYTNGFQQVFDESAAGIADGCRRGWNVSAAIVHTHLRLISRYGDSLIARKCGAGVARQAAARAERAWAAGEPGQESYERELAELDFWLRSDGNRRNPGTTADLIAAGLFVCLREAWIDVPLK